MSIVRPDILSQVSSLWQLYTWVHSEFRLSARYEQDCLGLLSKISRGSYLNEFQGDESIQDYTMLTACHRSSVKKAEDKLLKDFEPSPSDNNSICLSYSQANTCEVGLLLPANVTNISSCSSAQFNYGTRIVPMATISGKWIIEKTSPSFEKLPTTLDCLSFR